MRWIQRDQAAQKPKTIHSEVTGIPIQRKLPDQKIGTLPANDVRVCYQPTPVSPIGGGVVQCRGLGDLLRNFCCSCDDVPATGLQQPPQQQPPQQQPPPQQPPMGRMDGPCAVHALTCLNWDPNYKADRMNRIQNARFGALGMRMTGGDKLSALKDRMVMVEFFRTTEPLSFHVMYTDGQGKLRGVYNDTDMLAGMLHYSAPVPAFFERDDGGELIYNMENMVVNDSDRIYIKYVTKNQYMDYLASLNQAP